MTGRLARRTPACPEKESALVQLPPPEQLGLSSAALARIDEHLSHRYLQPEKIAGALTLVARRGQVAFLSPLGYSDRERGKPMRADTIFRIYSMSKPITSVALMMLHERAVFQLGDPVHHWIPEFEKLRIFRQGRYPRFVTEQTDRPMTIRDLLTHQSGLTYGFMERTAVDAAYRKLRLDDYPGTLREFVTQLATVPLEFSPGAHWNYSVATDVLGYLVEVMSGQPFDTYLREKIFEPLRMVDTDFTVPEDKRERFAASYRRDARGKLTLLDDPEDSPYCRPKSFLSGGGGLVSTVGDYYRFAEMLRRGGELDGARILGPRTLAYMTQNHLPDGQDLASCAVGGFSEARYEGSGFGLGFSVVTCPVRAQTPSTPGEFAWGGMASTAFWVDPKEELSVVFMTQLVPSSTYNFRGQLKSIIYGAIID